MNNSFPEILAPAGGGEQLTAALNAGADAVYFGATDFNARRNAENFTDADFLAAVRACHVRGVKVNVTLNTLILNEEFDRLLQTLRLIAESGADAVIVQDLAVAALVKKHVPTIRLHASTQMAAHNLAGVHALRDMGFSRVVLARELSLREIAAITENAGCETEVFVHGAHCMSASGLCYMSSLFGGRSGNRGLCAQPCRLNFTNDKRDHALSLRDLSLLRHLDDLKRAGVASFKIEGRMKRPEYVAAAVTACRQALAGEPYDEARLQAVFSRSGFTDGYFTGKINGAMFGARGKEDVTAAAGVLQELRGLYKDERKRVPLTMRLIAEAGSPLTLTVSDGERAVVKTGPAPEIAKNAPTTPEKAAAGLAKLGGTPYYCDAPEVSVGQGLLQYDYSPTFKLRFPLLYLACFAVAFLLKKLREVAHNALRESRKNYEYLSNHDALTKLYNRFWLQTIIANPEKYDLRPAAVAILDIDNFKLINDSYGHPNGDIVIREIGETILKTLNGSGDLCRWGGDEFLVLFHTDIDADTVCRRVVDAVHAHCFLFNGQDMRTTLSIGLVTAPNGSTTDIEALIHRADVNLYQAKENGRNRMISSRLGE